MNKPAVTQAQIRRTVKALEGVGKIVTGVRNRPDGTVDILTAADNDPAPVEPLDDELARWASKRGYD